MAKKNAKPIIDKTRLALVASTCNPEACAAPAFGTLRAGLLRAAMLMESVWHSIDGESMEEYDREAIADLLESYLQCEGEMRRGLLLGFADYIAITMDGGFPRDIESWEPCRREDGSSVLLKSVG